MSDQKKIVLSEKTPPLTSLEAWAELARKSCNNNLDDLSFVDEDGLKILPLYTHEFSSSRQSIVATHQPSPVFRALILEPTPTRANQAILSEISGGTKEFLLQELSPGQCGVEIEDRAGLLLMLENIDPNKIRVHLSPSINPERENNPFSLMEFFTDWLITKGVSHSFSGSFGLDPIGYVAAGRIGFDWLENDQLRSITAAVEKTIPALPNARILTASGTPYHEAGASVIQELGIMLATAAAYLRACDQKDNSVFEVASRMSIELSVDADILMTIAKLRAARLLWCRLCELCNISCNAPIDARLSARMLSSRDTQNNIIRSTFAALGANIASVDTISLYPFTHSVGRPDDFTRRIARNTQHILRGESQLGAVSDSASGSFAIEQLTDSYAQAAWDLFRDIERRGGIVVCLSTGWLQKEIGRVRNDRANQIAAGKRTLIGINQFQPAQAEMYETQDWNIPSVAQSGIEILRSINLDDGVM
jgi:methylmalonyl-CoA mutase